MPIKNLTVAGVALAVSYAVFFENSAAAESPRAAGYGVGNVDEGLVVGAIVGIGAVLGLGITYLVLHNRGVVEGCIQESGGKPMLVRSGKTLYSLSTNGPPLPVGERAKLKGHKSGQGPTPSFEVKKILKDYGRCQP